jgi:hypothetical protein
MIFLTEKTNKDSPKFRVIQPPEKTPEMLYNRIAVIFSGIVLFFLGNGMVGDPRQYIKTIGIVFNLTAFLLYYLLFIDFAAYYSIKIFGIVYLNYQRNRNLWFLFGTLGIFIAIGGLVLNYIPPTSVYYGPAFLAMTILCGILIDFLKPFYSPIISKIDEKYLKRFH